VHQSMMSLELMAISLLLHHRSTVDSPLLLLQHQTLTYTHVIQYRKVEANSSFTFRLAEKHYRLDTKFFTFILAKEHYKFHHYQYNERYISCLEKDTIDYVTHAYHATLYFLRGSNVKFNFPDYVSTIPFVSSLSHQQIQVGFAKYVMEKIPSSSPSMQNIKKNKNKARETSTLPSQPYSMSKTKWDFDSRHISKVRDLGLWESLFDGNGNLNFKKITSVEEALVLKFISTW
jgi:hypothetical protein